MAEYKRQAVLQELFNKAKTVCSKVYTSSRPNATEDMDKFIIVRLSQGISPYADTHNTAYGQFVCYVRDRQGGIENTGKMDSLIDGLSALFPFNDSLMSCNDTPKLLVTKSDGMGFHATVMQFKLVIKI